MEKLTHFSRHSSGRDRQLWGFFCLRLEELIYQTTLSALLGVQSRLSAWGLELTQSRRKLGELLDAFPLPGLEDTPAPPHPMR